MMVLLFCLGNLQASNLNPSTGVGDSVLVSYDELRVANSKMIQLEYVTKQNEKLNNIVKNDSVIITGLKEKNKVISKQASKYKKQRDVVGSVGGTGILLMLLLLVL